MGESCRHYAKYNKPVKKDKYQYYMIHLCEASSVVKFIQAEKTVAIKGEGKGRGGLASMPRGYLRAAYC